MKKLLALLLLLCCGSASAQLTTTNIGQGGYGAGLPTGPVDIVGSPVACWSLRACSTANLVKLVNICNSGDANCADVLPLANGDFNVATATGAPLNCGGVGGTCTIKIWYDQSGNANDVAQVTIAIRSTLVFSCLGSRPCAAYAGTQTLGKATFSSTSGQPFSMSVVVERTGTFTTQSTFLSFDFNGIQFLFSSTASTVGIFGGNTVPTAPAADSAAHSIQGLWNFGASKINVDGTNTSVSLGTGVNPLGNGICVGADAGVNCSAANPLTGRIMEAIVWTGDQSASFPSLCHNQFAYWGTSVSC